jgi:hypothetical protein
METTHTSQTEAAHIDHLMAAAQQAGGWPTEADHGARPIIMGVTSDNKPVSNNTGLEPQALELQEDVEILQTEGEDEILDGPTISTLTGFINGYKYETASAIKNTETPEDNDTLLDEPLNEEMAELIDFSNEENDEIAFFERCDSYAAERYEEERQKAEALRQEITSGELYGADQQFERPKGIRALLEYVLGDTI